MIKILIIHYLIFSVQYSLNNRCALGQTMFSSQHDKSNSQFAVCSLQCAVGQAVSSMFALVCSGQYILCTVLCNLKFLVCSKICAVSNVRWSIYIVYVVCSMNVFYVNLNKSNLFKIQGSKKGPSCCQFQLHLGQHFSQ